MWIRNLRRFIAEAFSGMFKNALMTIASIVVVTSCLIMLGVFLVVTLNVNKLSDNLADACQVKAYVTDEAQQSPDELKKIEQAIKKLKYAKEVQYENGVERFNEMKSKMTADELENLEGLPDAL